MGLFNYVFSETLTRQASFVLKSSTAHLCGNLQHCSLFLCLSYYTVVFCRHETTQNPLAPYTWFILSGGFFIKNNLYWKETLFSISCFCHCRERDAVRSQGLHLTRRHIGTRFINPVYFRILVLRDVTMRLRSSAYRRFGVKYTLYSQESSGPTRDNQGATFF
jgi:hypothetical protein